MIDKIKKTEEEWKKILTPDQYKIMRKRGTEPAFSCGWMAHKSGVYHCAACDLPIFRTDEKFESGTGWPSYFNPIDQENIEEIPDNSLGIKRTEVRCARCESHLGHVFMDPPRLAETRRREAGGPALTGKRYCINSISLNFKPNGTEK